MPIQRMKVALLCMLLLLLLALAACNGGSSTNSPPVTPVPTSSPVGERGAQLLAQAGQKLNGARTLHALVDINIVGPALNGIIKSEIWSLTPDENRSVVLQSNIGQF